jgi:hypothetical protein
MYKFIFLFFVVISQILQIHGETTTFAGGIVRIAGEEEEVYAMKMWRDMCHQGKSQGGMDRDTNTAVFCAMDGPEEVQVVYPTIQLQKPKNSPGK